MASNVEDLLQRYAAAATSAVHQGKLPADAAQAWEGVANGMGRLGAARVRDSARRRWLVEVHRDRGRGRILVVSPIQGDNEPFRASADGHRPDTHLRITPDEWTLLALLAYGHDGDEGREDEDLRNEAFRLLDRLVVEAQHHALMGAAEDEDEDGDE
ncbi:MAG TPA: hypothetical protein VFK85_07345 [Anaeromyxobacteraceae bacterium]|nr:hypothetical protein [Anaeromyxobacteraceae bacterium]